MTLSPGVVRDCIVDFLSTTIPDASATEITTAVAKIIGDVPASSVRSYLNLNTPDTFERTGRGRYRLRSSGHGHAAETPNVSAKIGKATIYQANCFEWLAKQPAQSIHAFVTDPPYGIVEYTEKEQLKLRAGRGGVWRIPPSFDGHVRAPLPRFTILSERDRKAMHVFFKRLAIQILRVCVPGANVVVAANPLLAHVVAGAMTEGGLELRGYLARQVMTMRGGDRPKNAHHEFDGVSVMPRSQWEPWVVLRTPIEGRVQDNLRKWGTGGFRRPSAGQPFGDMIKSRPTPSAERKIANHPSLKPQAFMRHVVRASLPLGKGIVCDPFMGGGSTMAAANAVGYDSVGTELDETYFALAKGAIKKLAAIEVVESNSG